MAIDFIPILKNAGLSESEVKTYLAGLELGPSSVQEIAQKAKISRTSAYDAIEGLKSHGLLSTSQRGKKTIYTVEDPDHLLNYLKGKKQKFSNQVDLIAKNMADLHLLAGGEKPVVKYFQGKNIIHSYFDDLRRKKPKEVYEIANLDDFNKFFPPDKVKASNKGFDRSKTKFHFMHIGDIVIKRENVEYKKLDIKKYGDFHGDISVYDNTLAMASLSGGLNLIIIEDEILAQTMKLVLKNIWDNTK